MTHIDCVLEYTINTNISTSEIITNVNSPHLSQLIFAKPSIKIEVAAENCNTVSLDL